jgi:hypothetical protein
VAGLQREFHVMAVLGHRPAEAFFGFADAVLDGVLVQQQPFGGALVASSAVKEDEQGFAEAGVVFVVGGQPAQGAVYPGAEQVGGAEHHRHRGDFAVGHRSRGRSAG